MKMNYIKNPCLLLCIIAVSAFAETSSTIHWPHHGDKVTKTHYEYVDVPSDTTVWDFSHAIETGDCHEMRWINLGDTLLVKIEQGVQSVYQLHDDTLFWNGYENALLCVRDSIAPIDAFNALVSACGVTSPLYFKGSYSGNHAIDMFGTYSVALSEYGTLILPNDTVENVLCITATKNCLERVSERKNEAPIHEDNDSLLREIEVVKRWYSPLYRYPLAENVSCGYYSNQVLLQQSEMTYLCSPEEQEYSLGILYDPESFLRNAIGYDANSDSNSNSNYGILGTNSSLADLVSVMQEQDNIIVSINGGKGDSNGSDDGSDRFMVLFCDVQGHVFHYSTIDGCGSISINTGSLSSGVYLIAIACGDKVQTIRIIIN